MLLDIFGFLNVLLTGFGRAAQCIYVGSIAFVFLLALPLQKDLGKATDGVIVTSRRIATISALALVVILAVSLWANAAILADTTGSTYLHALGGDFARAQMLRIIAGLLAVLMLRSRRKWHFGLPALALFDILAGVATSHAFARLENQALLSVATALHHIGAAIWVGGLPAFLHVLGSERRGPVLERVGKRYSAMSLGAVLAIALSGGTMIVFYVGSPEAMYGTAYGMMLGTKIALFLSMLLLGLLNSRSVRKLAAGDAGALLRLRRFIEVELGIGIAVIFIAASITSLPPAIDLTEGRATLADIFERLEPRWSPLAQPDAEILAFYEQQRQLAIGAAKGDGAGAVNAYAPGSGTPVPRNAKDIAWSEYNHHWSGIIVLLIGILAIAEATGRARWARHWPLLFIVLAGFLFVRTDSWPFGTEGLLESLRKPEYTQHRAFMLLIVGFAGFEWCVRTGRLTLNWARYVFPLISAAGGVLLLAHSHTIGNVKELLLIEISHNLIAILGIWAAWARWLELRLEGPIRTACGWFWPVSFCLVGLILIFYREI